MLVCVYELRMEHSAPPHDSCALTPKHAALPAAPSASLGCSSPALEAYDCQDWFAPVMSEYIHTYIHTHTFTDL